MAASELVAACTVPQPVPRDRHESTPAPVQAPPVPSTREPEREPAREPEPAPAPEPTVEAPGLPLVTDEFRLAAVHERALEMKVLADRSVAIYGDAVLAIAPAGGGPLRADPAWLRGWPLGPGPIGGRWPDQAVVTGVTQYARSSTTGRRWC